MAEYRDTEAATVHPRCSCIENFRGHRSKQGENVTSIVLLLGQGREHELVLKGAYRWKTHQGYDMLSFLPIRYCPFCGARMVGKDEHEHGA